MLAPSLCDTRLLVDFTRNEFPTFLNPCMREIYREERVPCPKHSVQLCAHDCSGIGVVGGGSVNSPRGPNPLCTGGHCRGVGLCEAYGMRSNKKETKGDAHCVHCTPVFGR
jgi:hypothetical protein